MELIPESLVSFLESGISVLIASANAQLEPSCARAAGARVSPDRKTVTVFVPSNAGGDVLRDLAEHKRAAVAFTRPIDERSLQVKGRVLAVRDATEDEIARARIYRSAFAQHVAIVGLPAHITERFMVTPLSAVEVEVGEIFRQTPGPDAGARL